MELKQEANTEPRKRFHMISRLRKALKYSENLMAISQDSQRVDARTKLELVAYTSYIKASFHFEMEQWEEAMSAYKETQLVFQSLWSNAYKIKTLLVLINLNWLSYRSIYTQIAQALGEHPEAAVYAEKTAEILPAMRFCAYKTGAGT